MSIIIVLIFLHDNDNNVKLQFFSLNFQSRLSPFANTKARRERKEGKDSCSKPTAIKSKRLERWFSLINAATLSQKRVLLPVKTLRSHLLLSSELHRTLYGFIVFEVAWTNVRGINYLNELQVVSLVCAPDLGLCES